MPLIPNPAYAPVRVTSVQLIPGGGTNEIRSELPPGWVEYHRYCFPLSGNLMVVTRLRSRLGLTSETHTHDENALGEPEDRGSYPFGLGDGSQPSEHPRPQAPAESVPKVRDLSNLYKPRPNGECLSRHTSSPNVKYTTRSSRSTGSSVMANSCHRHLPR